MNMMSTWINKAAHRPRKLLFSYLSRNKSNIPLNKIIKINKFIEHLSETHIGYYCYDLFPMNFYEFFQFLLIVISNYILLLSLILFKIFYSS